MGEHNLFTLTNSLSEALKYSVLVVPDFFHQDAKQYMTTARRTRKKVEETMFCVDNVMAVKHNFSPQMVKNLFNLDHVPLEVTIEPL